MHRTLSMNAKLKNNGKYQMHIHVISHKPSDNNKSVQRIVHKINFYNFSVAIMNIVALKHFNLKTNCAQNRQ